MKNRFNDLSLEEMVQKRSEFVREYRDMRFKKVLGHIESTASLRTLRRNIARLNTKIHLIKKREQENV